MRKALVLIALILLAPPARASWKDATDSIQGSRVSVNVDGKQKEYLELIPGKPAQLNLEKKTSTRWKIDAKGRGKLTLAKDGSPEQAKVIAKGENDFKIFLEPGKYKIVSSIGAHARCFIWKKRNLASLVPDGGGFATYMQSGDQKFAYYRATPDTLPVLSLKGPTTAYIFFRANLPKDAQKVSIDVAVMDGDSVVAHKISDAVKSLKAEPSEDTSLSISEAIVLKVSVPEGNKKYTIHPNKCSGYVKFYKSEKKKKSAGFDQNESLNSATGGDELAATDLVEEDEVEKGDEEVRKLYRLSIRVGAVLDDNVYRYSDGYRDTFDLGLKSYRYPGVKSMSDFILPMETKASATFAGFTASAGLTYNVYGSNTNLNNLGYSLSLTWSGPLKLHVAYRLTPRDPIRPTFFATRSYELMSYSENRGTLSAQWTRWRLKPSVDFSMGYYDYNATFDAYDAPFYEAGFALTKAKPVGFRIDVEAGAVTARHHTGEDWSNTYASLGADLHIPWMSWTAGMKGAVARRVYGSTDTIDNHYHRMDMSGDGFGYVKYQWSDFEISSKAGLVWRSTTSPFPVIGREKDYRSWMGGLEFSWDIRV